jgi:hypothetical protein
MSTSSGGSGSWGPELRIGDDEREAAVSALGEHYAAGRLTKDEFDERSARAYAARTRSELWPMFTDLPRPEQPRPAAPTLGADTGRERHGRPGRPFGIGLLPVLLVALVVSILVGHPVILLVLLGFLVLKVLRFRGYAGRHHHHAGGRQHR